MCMEFLRKYKTPLVGAGSSLVTFLGAVVLSMYEYYTNQTKLYLQQWTTEHPVYTTAIWVLFLATVGLAGWLIVLYNRINVLRSGHAQAIGTLQGKYDAIDANVSTVATFKGMDGKIATFQFENKHPDKNVIVRIEQVKVKHPEERGANFTPCAQEMATSKAFRGGHPVPIRCPVPLVNGRVTGFEGVICFEGEPPKPYSMDFE